MSECLRAGVTRALQDNEALAPEQITPGLVEIVVRLGTALQWTPIAIGEPPEIDRAMGLIRTLLV